jgi:regulator of sigma E protease
VFTFILSFLVFAGVILAQGVARMPMTVGELHPVPLAAAAGEGLRPGDVILSVDGKPVPDEGGWDDFIAALPEASTLSYAVEREGTRIEVQAPHIFPPLVSSVTPDSAASAAGLKVGDVIVSLDGTDIATFPQLRRLTGESDGRTLMLSVWRNGTTTDVALVPKRSDLPLDGGQFETRWLIGVTGGLLFQPQTETPSLAEAAGYAVHQTWRIVESSVSGLYHMAAGAISSCNLRGPLGIAETSGQAASQGIASFIWFIAVLSAAVGLLNLFPVPILDGGHLVFHAWEALTGRAPGDRALRVMMSFGLVVLVALMTFALTNDLRC